MFINVARRIQCCKLFKCLGCECCIWYCTSQKKRLKKFKSRPYSPLRVCRTRPKLIFGCTHIVCQTVQKTGLWSATYGTVRYRNIQKSRSYSRLRVYFCGDIAVQKQCSKLVKGLVHEVLSMVLYKCKNTFWRHSKRVGHNPNFGLLSVAILWQCTDNDANQ